MQVRVILVLVLFDVWVVVNQVPRDGEEAPDVVELEAGIQKFWSEFIVLVSVVPEAEPVVKVVELDYEETVGKNNIPQVCPVKVQSACSNFRA
jgi:hypothetical protein